MRTIKVTSVAVLILLSACRRPSPEETWQSAAPDEWHERAAALIKHGKPLRVSSSEFHTATGTAVDIWNWRLGCSVFEHTKPGDGVTNVNVLSADGAPCGSAETEPAWAVGVDPAAAAFRCGRADGWAQIHIWHPGDTWQQAFIITHELGHVLGLDDDQYGVMGPVPSGQALIRPRDSDAAALRSFYCP